MTTDSFKKNFGITNLEVSEPKQTALSVRMATELVPNVGKASNVIAVLPGTDPKLKDEYIVFGAHMDHLGYAETSSRSGIEDIHYGADDNASGSAGVVAMAEYFAKAGGNRRSIIFQTYSGEELGLLGARAWVRDNPEFVKKTYMMINMDMIGRLRSKELVVGGVDSAHGLLDALTPMFIDSGLKISADPSGRGPSDHAPFYGAGVPVLFFFSGVHDVYHKPGDQGYSVDPRGIPAVLDLVERIALWRAAAGTKLDYWNGVRTQEPAKDPAQAAASAAPVGNDRGYAPVRLGIQPGLVESGESGIGVESVSEGTSAADAGIKPGDVLLAWNGESLDSVGTMMTKLRATKPGDVVKMRILRGNEELTIDVKMKASTAPRRPADE